MIPFFFERDFIYIALHKLASHTQNVLTLYKKRDTM